MSDDAQETRARSVSRYGQLARAAAGGDQITDCAPEVFAESRFAAAYDDVSGLPS
jgi:hypothetical protein